MLLLRSLGKTALIASLSIVLTTAIAAAEAKGKVASVAPAKNELVLTENVKDLVFQLAKDAQVSLNGRAAKLADLQAGDNAIVTYERQGQRLTATVIRCTRKGTKRFSENSD